MQENCCPLCDARQGKLFFKDRIREYWRCGICELVFVLPKFYLDAAAEKREYDLHENSDSEGYRRFLGRVFQPLLLRIKPESIGFDFGCGPEPVLAKVLGEHGHKVSLYDVFYFRDESVFDSLYDFITATEVFEHLHKPYDEFSRLWRVLTVGGSLAIMTKLVVDAEAFSRWHYKNDLTHVCFFSRQTFEWLAVKFSAKLEFDGKDVVFFTKLAA